MELERGIETVIGGIKNNGSTPDKDRRTIIEAVREVQKGLGELDYLSCPETFELIRSARSTSPEYVAGWCKYGQGCEQSDCPINLGKNKNIK